MKKLVLATVVATLLSGVACGQGIINDNYGSVVSVDNAKQLEAYVDYIKRDVDANTQDIMMVNNDSVIRDFRLQDQLNKQGTQIDNNNTLIQAQQTQIKELKNTQAQQQVQLDKIQSNIENIQSDLNDFKHDTNKGIATAVAIAGIEYPTYDDEHKFKIAVATGSYKGETAIAYGVAYTPNYDTIISIKGTDEATAVSVGFNL